MKKIISVLIVLSVFLIGCSDNSQPPVEISTPAPEPEEQVSSIEEKNSPEPESSVENDKNNSSESNIPNSDTSANLFVDQMNIILEDGGIVLPYGEMDNSEWPSTDIVLDDNTELQIFNANYKDSMSPVSEVSVVMQEVTDEHDAAVFGLLSAAAIKTCNDTLSLEEAADIASQLVSEANQATDNGKTAFSHIEDGNYTYMFTSEFETVLTISIDNK